MAVAGRRLADAILGTEPKLRFVLTIWAVSVASYAVYCAIMLIHVAVGFVALRMALMLIVGSTLMNLVFYVLIRSGLSRFRRDRGLGLEQLICSALFMWLNYAVVGPTAGATLMIMASLMVYAIFFLPSRGVWWLAALLLTGQAATMLICNAIDPVRYPAKVQATSYLYAAVVIPLIARLAHYVTRMQDVIRERGSELRATLAKVQELATRDELTKTYNRRYLGELLDQMSALHIRRQSPMCIALLDIDHFKSVNDRFGHDAGDLVLKRFAGAVQADLRAGDVLGRWGGEEFLLCLPDTSPEHAGLVLSRMRQQMRTVSFEDVAADLKVTFSAGIAELRAGEPIAETIKRADEAMYRAKHAGRDRHELH